jgi:hypothetical protein|tara:strand:+ start:117 stop:320 length:204 start_codon:yes stop_codon:yes gene_type:complete
MTHQDTLNGVPLVIEYDYQKHGDKLFPKIQTIVIDDKWDLTEIIDHSLVEQIKSRIFKILNKDIYNK